MKITVFIVVFASMQTFALDNYAQTKRMDVKVDESSIVAALEKIEAQSEFFFFYNNKVVKLDKKVSVDLKHKTINEILDVVFKDTDIDYTINNRQIILSGKEAGSALNQQQKSISGKVTDSSGGALPGVTVAIKGTTNGTITDANGKYSLANIPENATLQFSFVGMKTQEVAVGNKTAINITLVEETVGIEEVVAIGYGTQKKVNLTGSIASIGAAELIKRPVTNAINLLQGKVTGLQISQAEAKPGEEGNVLRIRGTGTFSSAGSNPLILVNGIMGDMTNLNPDDIESVSILKDAAACAIYGARAANGVILVTTKAGKAGAFNIEYHANVQLSQATRLPKLLYNSADYMMYWNQAKLRSGQLAVYTQEEIDAFRNNPNDPVNYPNFNWIDYMFHTGISKNHHLNISGGNDKTTYNIGLGYLDQNGVVSFYNLKKINGNFSIDTKVKDWITIGSNIQMANRDLIKDRYDNAGGEYILAVYGSGPNYTPFVTLPDGTTRFSAKYTTKETGWTARNPVAEDASGDYKENRFNMSSQFYVDIKLGENLNWYSKGAVILDYFFSKRHDIPVSAYYFKEKTYALDFIAQNAVADSYNKNSMTTFYSTLNYHKIFNEIHNVNVLAGYNQEYNYYNALSGSRVVFPTNTVTEINAGSAVGLANSGTANAWAIQSLFGRLMYDMKSKYLFEANVRYDGTSRIAEASRWGFFPSVSAAWRLSEEAFMKQLPWLQNLKLRGSWGQLGNQNVGLYPYQDILTNTAYPFAGLFPGALVTRMVDKTLKWETTTMTDFGLDLNLRNGLFTATVDWFDKVTDNILYQVPIPLSVGLSAPTVNYGKMRNRGWELELGHQNQIGEFRYDVSVNYTYIKNNVIRLNATSYGAQYAYDPQTITKEGIPFNSYYMIEWIGIFQNQAEIDNGPKHPFNPKPGDLKYKDQLTVDADGDGIMDAGDNIIDSKDRVVLPGAYPFYYGGALNLAWKNFTLSAIFQGVQGQKLYLTGWGLEPFNQGTPPRLEFIKTMWTGEGSTNSQPAMYQAGYTPVTGTWSSYWLVDASYFRMKNLAIGYNIPKNLCQKIGLKDINVYISADNLFTLSKYPEGDPERANIVYNRFNVYPQVSIYTFGIKVKL